MTGVCGVTEVFGSKEVDACPGKAVTFPKFFHGREVPDVGKAGVEKDLFVDRKLFPVCITQGQSRSEIATGAVARNGDTFQIEPECLRVLEHPLQSCLSIIEPRRERMLRGTAIVDRHHRGLSGVSDVLQYVDITGTVRQQASPPCRYNTAGSSASVSGRTSRRPVCRSCAVNRRYWLRNLPLYRRGVMNRVARCTMPRMSHNGIRGLKLPCRLNCRIREGSGGRERTPSGQVST